MEVQSPLRGKNSAVVSHTKPGDLRKFERNGGQCFQSSNKTASWERISLYDPFQLPHPPPLPRTEIATVCTPPFKNLPISPRHMVLPLHLFRNAIRYDLNFLQIGNITIKVSRFANRFQCTYTCYIIRIPPRCMRTLHANLQLPSQKKTYNAWP